MIIINGKPLCKHHAGVQRYMVEIIRRIDELLPKYGLQVMLVYPENENIRTEGLKNIKYMPIGKMSKRWEWDILEPFAKNNHGIICGMANDTCVKNTGVICLHDIYSLHKESHFPLKTRVQNIVKYVFMKIYNCKVVTVSEYSKTDIMKRLHISEDKIKVIYNGHEHMRRMTPDVQILNKFSLKKDDFYYSMGDIAPHKNFRWVIEMAKKNKNDKFVVAGWMPDEKSTIGTDLKNVLYVGRVSDEENKALLMNCRAYLHPSKIEGFGIPPLEALVCGSPIIISNSSCLPEIYGKCAHYFDPNDYSVDLEKKLQESVESPNKLFEKYSWDKAAKQWLELFREIDMK